MRPRRYLLVGTQPVPLLDNDLAHIIAWGKMMRGDERRLGLTEIPPGVWVSTIFLGLDQHRNPGGPPLLFATTVFRGGTAAYTWLYDVV